MDVQRYTFSANVQTPHLYIFFLHTLSNNQPLNDLLHPKMPLFLSKEFLLADNPLFQMRDEVNIFLFHMY